MESITNTDILKILTLINISALFYVSFSFIPTMIGETERFHKMKLNLLRIEKWLNNRNIRVIELNQERVCIDQKINEAKKALDYCIKFWEASSNLIKIIVIFLLIPLAFVLLVVLYQSTNRNTSLIFILLPFLFILLLHYRWPPLQRVSKITIIFERLTGTISSIIIYIALISVILYYDLRLNKLLSNDILFWQFTFSSTFFAIWSSLMIFSAIFILWIIRAIDSQKPYSKYWEIINLIEEGCREEKVDKRYIQMFKY